MIEINEKYALEIPDERNINVMVLREVKKKDGQNELEWQLFGHAGRDISEVIRLITDAEMMDSQARDLQEFIRERNAFMQKIKTDSLFTFDALKIIDALQDKIKTLEGQSEVKDE